MINDIERVGVYGGTFSPIHNGHVAAARAFFEQMKLDKLLIIPTYITPHKEMDVSDNPEHRMKMCELAFKNDMCIEVSDIEIKRGGKSYTVDTIKALCEPDRKLFLMCGTDMMLSFDRWRDFETIFKLCCPVYVRRENDTTLDSEIIKKNQLYYEKYGVAFRKIVVDPVNINSTDIRDAVKNHRDITGIVPAGVAEYIRKYGLYNA